MHPPKVSRYDVAARTHTVSKGDVYPVERFEQGDGWLYLERPLVDHPHIASMAAYLLPALGLQVNRWGHHPGSEYAWYDFYIDVMAFEPGETLWTSRDFYLDVIVVEGSAAYITDTDEFLAAQAEGLITQAEAAYALEATHTLLNGLGECGYSLRAYLKKTVGLEVTF